MDVLKGKLAGHFDWRPLAKYPPGVIDKQIAAEAKWLKPFEFCMPKLRVGIEIEVENIRDAVLVDRNLWSIKEDGSLRNRGFEFVSCPIQGEEIRYAVQHFFKELPNKADFSDRTSIHVHVNARDMSHEDLMCLLLYYTVFEKLLYRFAGPKRFKNIFCVPVQETKLPIALENFLVNGNLLDLISAWAKYSGLNLLPLRNFGSVEYRQMLGHRDPMLLLTWINIIQRLHKAATNSKFEPLYNKIKKLNTNSMYDQFLIDVFGRDAELLKAPDLQKEMEYGASVVKSIRLPSPFLKGLLNDISNNSNLLKSLNISEADAKKSDAVVREAEPQNMYDDFEAILAAERRQREVQWMADLYNNRPANNNPEER